MTAEQQPPPQAREGGAAAAASSNTDADDSQARSSSMLANQLREITGIQDPLVLHETLKAADGDLREAVMILTEGQPKESVQEPSDCATEPSDCEGSVVGRQQATSTIDSAPHNPADLQKCRPSRIQTFPDISTFLEDLNATVNAYAICLFFWYYLTLLP